MQLQGYSMTNQVAFNGILLKYYLFTDNFYSHWLIPFMISDLVSCNYYCFIDILIN